jgi:uncharacterized protein YjbI with pentapeptide repeats
MDALAAWNHIVGSPQNDLLGIPRFGDRLDLRKLRLDGRRSEVQGRSIDGVDFSGGSLGVLRFVNCNINNCVFDGCLLREIKVWSSRFVGCDFRGASLRGAVMGGVQLQSRDEKFKDGARTEYSDCVFDGADIRDSVHGPSLFRNCLFRDVKMKGVDFRGSQFVGGVIASKLADVMFYRTTFDYPGYPANEMDGVDLTGSELCCTGFRGMALSRTSLPRGDDYLLIDEYGETVDMWLRRLAGMGNAPHVKGLATFLNVEREWAPPGAKRVVCLQDLARFFGPESVALLRLLYDKYR